MKLSVLAFKPFIVCVLSAFRAHTPLELAGRERKVGEIISIIIRFTFYGAESGVNSKSKLSYMSFQATPAAAIFAIAKSVI